MSLSHANTHLINKSFYDSLVKEIIIKRGLDLETRKEELAEQEVRGGWRQPGVKIVGNLRLCDSAEEGALTNLPLTSALNRSLGIMTLTQSAEGGIRFPGALVPLLLTKKDNVIH
jgi:hypothetical protein